MLSDEEPAAASGGESGVEQITAEPSGSLPEPELDHADMLPSQIGGWLSTDCSRLLNVLWRANPLQNHQPPVATSEQTPTWTG